MIRMDVIGVLRLNGANFISTCKYMLFNSLLAVDCFDFIQRTNVGGLVCGLESAVCSLLPDTAAVSVIRIDLRQQTRDNRGQSVFSIIDERIAFAINHVAVSIVLVRITSS